jgi:hypothetical protein
MDGDVSVAELSWHCRDSDSPWNMIGDTGVSREPATLRRGHG